MFAHIFSYRLPSNPLLIPLPLTGDTAVFKMFEKAFPPAVNTPLVFDWFDTKTAMMATPMIAVKIAMIPVTA